MNLLELVSKFTFDADTTPLQSVETKLDHIGHKLEFLAAAEVVRGIFELTERFSNFASEIATSAIAAGLSAESLQKIQFAAEQAGSSSGEVTGAMQKLTRVLYEAQSGSEEARKSFLAAGISVAELKGFKTGADALGALSDRVKGISDPIKKQALATKLLGRGAGNMVEFLDQGSAAIKEMGDQAERMGAVLSDENVAQLKEFEDGMGALWRTVKVFAATIAAAFAPGIKQATKAILEWWTANRALVSVNIKGWVDTITYAFGYVFGVVEGLIDIFVKFAAQHPVLVSMAGKLVLGLMGVALAAGILVKGLGLTHAAFGLLGDAAAALKVPFDLFFGAANLAKRALVLLIANIGVAVSTAFPALGGAITAVATAIQATPIGWLLAGLAAVVVAGHDIWTMLSGGSWEDTWLYKLYETLKNLTGGILKKFGIDLQSMAAPAGVVPSAPLPGLGGDVPNSVMQDHGDWMEQGRSVKQAASENAEKAVQNVHAPVSQTLNADVKIIAQPGVDTGKLANQVADKLTKDFQRQSREMQRALVTNQAY